MTDITLENPEEQVHWLLTRRAPAPAARAVAATQSAGAVRRRLRLGGK